ncbi:kelch-like protein 26 [Diadema antillarum]|uniref:kelch-like protein 26 n=1 Tax=Diadema antillarum TaxID=105358 RepID=UPI003A847591
MAKVEDPFPEPEAFLNDLSPRKELSPRKNPMQLNLTSSLGRRSPLKPANKSYTRLTSSLSSIHGGRVLKELNTFRNQGLLCDVTVVANGTKLEAHRTILAANSKYLREQLLKIASRAKSPVTKPEIVLEGVSIGALRAVTSFMYTSDLGGECTMEQIADVFRAADYLEMPDLKQYCTDQTKSLLKPETCLDALQISRNVNSDEIKSIIERYVAENFVLLARGGDGYLSMTAEDLLAVRQHEEFSGPALELLRALIAWVEHDREARMRHAETLLSVVRFHDIRPTDIQCEISAIECRLADPDDAALKQTILSCIAARTQDCIRPSHMTRAPGDAMFALLGGDNSAGAPSDRMFTFKMSTGQWEEGAPMPIKRLDHASTVLNGIVYVAGGQHSAHNKAADSIGTCHDFDPQTGTWTQLCPMQKRRAVFTLNTLENRIYAVGGKNAHGSLASVEYYDPATKSWTYVSHMYTGLFGHASVTLDGKIYVSGGVVAGRHFTNALQCYHPQSDKWVHMSCMSAKRAFHMMCAVDGQLYVFGGNTRDASSRRIDCDSVESYDLTTDRWRTVESMPRPVCFAGAVTHGDMIYVVGGFNGKKGKRYPDVQYFDVRDRTWSLIGQLPAPIMRHSMCAIESPTALIVH